MFFKADWIVDREGIPFIEKLFDAAADLNCILWTRSYWDNEQAWTRFIVQFPDLKILYKFLCSINQMPFVQWEEIQLPEEEILPLEKPVRISEWSGNNYASFIKGFYYAAQENEDHMNNRQPK